MPPIAVCKSTEQMGDADANAAEEHHPAPAQLIDEQHRKHSKDKIDGTCDHDIEKDVVRAVACAAVNLGCIVEENVDTSPLLQYRKPEPPKDDASDARTEKISPRGLLLIFRDQGMLYACHFAFGIVRPANARKHGVRLALSIACQKPARTLRQKQRRDCKDDRGHDNCTKHPSPAVLHVP